MEKLLKWDGERENKYAETELGEIEERCENSVSTPEVAVNLGEEGISEDKDWAWCLSKSEAVLARDRDRDGDRVVDNVESEGWGLDLKL